MTSQSDALAELHEIHEALLAPSKMAEGARRERAEAEAAFDAIPEGPARKKAEPVRMRARERDAMAMLFLAGVAMNVSRRLEAYLLEASATPAPPAAPKPAPVLPPVASSRPAAPSRSTPAATPAAARKKGRS
jgi:hypothetical protein